ncbi:MAG: class I SAM-dependent methyltransferase [Rhodoplanes sp.]
MAGYERSLERTRSYLRPTDKVLEFGCGTGGTALKLAPSVASIVATDISGEMIAIARERAAAAGCANVTFEKGTLDTIGYEDTAFDVVLGYNALHVLRKVPAALVQIRRLLRPNGVFISKTPCIGDASLLVRAALPVLQLIGKAPYLTALTGDTLKREISNARFTLVEEGNHDTKGSYNRHFLVARAS